MAAETNFIAALRTIATHPGARGLADDAAVLEVGGITLVLTHDAIVEGVHFLAGDPPQDVAWKLVAVNLSDLAAKGARPAGALLGYGLRGDPAWDRGFLDGLEAALAAFDLPLLGGDTVSLPASAPRSFGLTAIGRAEGPVPARSGARIGDILFVSGVIGDAGAGLAGIRRGGTGPQSLALRYRRPTPRLEAGVRLAPLVGAMMDVSDGLLIDASRIAAASGAALVVDLAKVPLSADFRLAIGDDEPARCSAATAGDDYELLFSAPPDAAVAIAAVAAETGLALTAIGAVVAGEGLRLRHAGDPVALPERLGWEHH